ncbi:hypothetical protein F0U61_00575 [Archangium violaceum]|uniref:hypothetical protein n=1 Tax=Archangium violaceum TaxID=83451 RepID=UPI002B2B5A2E|nr:hypothetical protein F0U61_00575 [Archangium violaceum]
MSKLVALIAAVVSAAGVLVPVAAYAYGMEQGPCTVSVQCLGGSTIGCGGQTVCYWKVDSIRSRGFVECDDQGPVTCGLID